MPAPAAASRNARRLEDQIHDSVRAELVEAHSPFDRLRANGGGLLSIVNNERSAAKKVFPEFEQGMK
jgi:hypothetical protein